ncbi:TonB family protein [Flavobacterium arsenatis]|uniref:TonB family protein n=1 Tax=Flavobacterium arsenatis TaxID=1484332 RepID=A0ABU1TUI8_9FLAO|nr:energy transducer TonB [Flavobacterium arsenatis]MDR6969536.1 TonB family protein [Flavobacterium arsenatis]
MKKIIFAIAILISSCTFAQTNELYHIYKFHEKAGVTDTLSNDVLPANYKWYVEELYGKNKWIFKNDNETVIFSRENGTNEYVEEIITYRFSYKNEMYMQITDNGRDYLLSHHSDTRFDLPKGRENIQTVGDYFYQTETIFPESKSYRDKKTGKLMPPKVSEPQNQFQIFKNPADAKPVLEIIATGMYALWKDKNYESNFDYTAFTTEKQIKIYDHNLKLIKTTSKPKDEYLDINHLVSEALGEKVSQRYPSPTMSEIVRPEYPLIDIRKKNGQNQVFIERKYYDNNPLILFSTQYDVSARKNTITLKKDDEKIAQFDVNLHLGKIYYPKIYLDQLGLGFFDKEGKSASNDNNYEGEILNKVDERAIFRGGNNAISKHISTHLIYPDEAKESGIQGNVIAKFVVEKDGSVSNIEIERSLSKECDAEVIRIISKMPKWTPAKKDGIAVRSYYRLPVMFKTQ